MSESPELSPSPEAGESEPPKKRSPILKSLFAILLILFGVSIFMRPAPDVFDFDAIDQEQSLLDSKDPLQDLKELWKSGKIAQRRFVILNLRNKANDETKPEWREYLLGPVLEEGVGDADIQVRELILSALGRIHSAMKDDLLHLGEGDEKDAGLSKVVQFESKYLIPACTYQMDDPDPLVRAMGIRFARGVTDKSPLVMNVLNLLDDPNPELLAQSAAFLRLATGEDFNILLKNLPDSQPANASTAIQEKIQEWGKVVATSEDDYRMAEGRIRELTPPTPHLSHDYMQLKVATLDGKKLQLKQFRGKVVLLSFWTSWCTPCVDELPALDKIQKNNADQVKIITVSLDGVPSSHGVRDENGTLLEDAPGNTPRNRSKIDQMVARTGIELDIVWDFENLIAPRYKGDDLPTHALYDKSGHLVRVFTGSRTEQDWLRIVKSIADLKPPH